MLFLEKHIKLFINLSPTFTTCVPSITIRRLNLDKETGQNYKEQNEIEMERFFCKSIFLCYVQKFRFQMVLYAFSKLRAQCRVECGQLSHSYYDGFIGLIFGTFGKTLINSVL